VFRDNYNNNII